MSKIYELRIYLKNVKKTIGEKFVNTINYKNISKDDVPKILGDHKDKILKHELRVMKVFRIKKKKKTA